MLLLAFIEDDETSAESIRRGVHINSNDAYDSLVTTKTFVALGIFFISVASASALLTLPDSAERPDGALSFDTDFPLASFLAGSAFIFF
eukprot:jgi/Psemu1/19133/gm1.19133_g